MTGSVPAAPAAHARGRRGTGRVSQGTESWDLQLILPLGNFNQVCFPNSDGGFMSSLLQLLAMAFHGLPRGGPFPDVPATCPAAQAAQAAPFPPVRRPSRRSARSCSGAARRRRRRWRGRRRRRPTRGARRRQSAARRQSQPTRGTCESGGGVLFRLSSAETRSCLSGYIDFLRELM